MFITDYRRYISFTQEAMFEKYVGIYEQKQCVHFSLVTTIMW